MDHVAAAATSALRWSLTSRIYSNGRRHGNTDTWPQHEAWRRLADTEAGLPVHLLLPTISVLRTFFTGFVTSSGLRVASVPQPRPAQNLWTKHEEKHPTRTRTHTPVAQVAYLFTHVTVRACGGCNTAQRWHFRNLQHNWKKQSLENPTSEWARLWLTKKKKDIYWEINLFLQVNVFIRKRQKNTNPKPYWLYCQTVFPGGPAYAHESIKDNCLPW